MKFDIRPLSPKVRAMFLASIVGETTCPHCLQTNIKVVDQGEGCGPRRRYLENHHINDQSSELCPESEKFEVDFN